MPSSSMRNSFIYLCDVMLIVWVHSRSGPQWIFTSLILMLSTLVELIRHRHTGNIRERMQKL